MNFEEVKGEGLSREYIITISKEDVGQEYKKQLEAVRTSIKLPGFRNGKVPANVAKSQYGPLIVEKTLEKLIDVNTTKLVKDNSIIYVDQPKVEVTSEINQSDLSHNDLTFKVSLEIFPEIPEIDFSDIVINRNTVDVAEEDISKTIGDIAKTNQDYQPSSEKIAKDKDAVLIDYVGRIDDVEFAGGKGENHKLVLGSNSFIPGSEDQLIGAERGTEKIVNVTFPEEYHSKEFAGKKAEFTVKINDILSPQDHAIDDEFAKKFGLENLEKLREAVKDKLNKDVEEVNKTYIKKELFDKLEKKCDFLVPSSLVDKEYEILWNEFLKSKNKEFEGKTEEEQKQEFRSIANRRVILGLLITEIARKENINIEQVDIREAINKQASQFAGQEHIVLDYYRKNPKALDALKGPIIENKVVDYILSKVKIDENKMTVEEFFKLNNV